MKSPLMPFDDALAALLAHAAPVAGTEHVPTLEADGRVLAQAQRSTMNVPAADNTQMDGYAVRCADLSGATGEAVRLRVSQKILAGHPGSALEPGTAARIFTGAEIPDGADAVVMQEQAQADGEHVLIQHRPQPGEWIRRTGEDIREGGVILEAGTRLTPQATGLAASIGLARLPVRRRVRVACFHTGDELVMPGESLPPGAIYNSNRFFLGALLRRLGCEVTDLGIVPDSLEATRAALREAAAGHDLVLTSGGVSVGDADHVKPAVQAEGSLDLWQIAIKPGKPLAYGRVRRGRQDAADAAPSGAAASGTAASGAAAGPDLGEFAHFIGLPGNPVSSFVTLLLLVRPFVLRLAGARDIAPQAFPLRADFDWPRPDKRREFLRARVNSDGGLDLFPNQGSAVLTSTVWADGLVDNPAGRAIARGETVRFLPMAGLLG
ncbi:molybdopterin molybdotransferase MoeA [Quisquiliibacterium transsilvanicum]|uniref:Molybdopterin molybdenumtransferase n=1 Tax=Quisquiliibacterium transsilvanicum TaxID=1549638 RepID=A0A7W8HFR3_9BURK|nr:gephyrin-like molybdotransferase Glp [Quisquiliibacterium transsilvanicum]MBB5271027.1 molybdopterin molybdotransferase [Quisquiliibacterium transsilvanicum]